MKIGPASDALRVAAEKLAFIVGHKDQRGTKMDTRDCEDLLDAGKRFKVATNSVAQSKTPRRHIVWHTIVSSCHMGNL